MLGCRDCKDIRWLFWSWFRYLVHIGLDIFGISFIDVGGGVRSDEVDGMNRIVRISARCAYEVDGVGVNEIVGFWLKSFELGVGL